jgi:6-pyruvoyltetrahydropterin/6-carboxytetrahydropterin synthase
MVRSKFSAAHQLREVGGSCEQLHGHTWQVEVFLKGEKLEDVGILMDFRKIKSIVKKWIDKLDHQYLNNVLEGINPTTENLARYLFEELEENIYSKRVKLSKVRVWESDDACVSYEKPYLVSGISYLEKKKKKA